MPVHGVDDLLTSRGIVLFAKDQQPIVLCAVDFTGIANASHDAWREALAKAADTTPERVAVHCLHQHDAPEIDGGTDALLAAQGMGGATYNVKHAQEALDKTAAAVAEAVKHPQTVTHVGFGKAEVVDVASNRRVLGPDGKVKWIRWSATKDPEARAQPVGTIDPLVRAISFWNGDQPVAVLTYYTTHPQSYYGAGQVTWDFRASRGRCANAVPGVAWIHFNGASERDCGKNSTMAIREPSRACGQARRTEQAAFANYGEATADRERRRCGRRSMRVAAALEISEDHERPARGRRRTPASSQARGERTRVDRALQRGT